MKKLIKSVLQENDIPYGCKYWSDVERIDIIKTALENGTDEDGGYGGLGTANPDTDGLLDAWEGYDKQTYIQLNDDKTISVYEGWSKLCWEALYQKPEYIHGKKKMPKEDAIKHILNVRFPVIAKALDMEIVEATYWFEEAWMDGIADGYIMKITLKKL